MLRKILFWTSKSGSCVTLVVLPIIVILEWSQAFTDCSKEAEKRSADAYESENNGQFPVEFMYNKMGTEEEKDKQNLFQTYVVSL